MAIGVIPVILAMGRRQREEEAERAKQRRLHPPLPHLCYVSRGYSDGKAVPVPRRAPDKQYDLNHPCGCTETRQIWRSQPFDIGRRLITKDCGGVKEN